MQSRRITLGLAAAFVAVFLVAMSAAHAESEAEHGLKIQTQPRGSVSREAGLASWGRIYEVFSHPRCANCHTDRENIPMWTDNDTGVSRDHGMHINAGASRTGEEYLACTTCHMTSTRPNTTPHAPPHAGMPWQLAPVEFLWFDEDSQTICSQVRDPRRNGGRDGDGLIEHILHDEAVGGFITWAFEPGGGREPAPGTLQEHLDDTVAWVAAGMPCPGD